MYSSVSCNARLMVLAIMVFMATSCNDKKKEEATHLSREVMQKVLLDVNIAEAYSTMVKDTVHKVTGKNYDSLAVYYKGILAHHKVSADQFTQSLRWYKLHPEEMDSIYVKMIPVAEQITAAPAAKK